MGSYLYASNYTIYGVIFIPLHLHVNMLKIEYSHLNFHELQQQPLGITNCKSNNLLYKAEKPSVCLSAFFPRQAANSAVSTWIDARFARNESYVLWHL